MHRDTQDTHTQSSLRLHELRTHEATCWPLLADRLLCYTPNFLRVLLLVGLVEVRRLRVGWARAVRVGEQGADRDQDGAHLVWQGALSGLRLHGGARACGASAGAGVYVRAGWWVGWGGR